jgi:bifunctional non-homologous end joining protein LigD
MSPFQQETVLGLKRAKTSAPYPGFIQYCDPMLSERAPSGEGWAHEIKADGYRAQLHVNDGKVTIYSRRGNDWTETFGAIAEAAHRLKVRQLILDGEAVVVSSTGVADFHALRRERGRRNSERLTYQAFDLLYLNGRDFRPEPYVDRKAALKRLLANAPNTLSYVDYMEGDGETIFKHACAMGLEGIVSKRLGAPYRSGRTSDWVKLKCVTSGSFPIIAFVEKLGARPRRIASLYVGRWEGARLVYTGKVQTGFTMTAMRYIRERLDPLIIPHSALSSPIKKPKATWVQPLVRAEVAYTGVTEDGLLREAVFKGLSEPTAPAVVRPRGPSERLRVPRENILQLLPDAPVPTKEQLTAYWTRIWRKALKYLARRPLKLVRHVHGTTFYHKGPLPEVPEAVHRLTIEKREGGEGTRLWVDDLAGLLGLVEIGAVELHPWNSTVDDLEHPNVLVFDLDPGEGVEWSFVRDTALQLRTLLKSEGHTSWPKLTGGKGVHVMVPLERKMTHDQAHRDAWRIAERLAATDQDRYTTSASLAKRPGRLFIDYLRNGRGTTAIGTYSPRVRPGFPIAAPVSWKAVERGVRPDAFHMETV